MPEAEASLRSSTDRRVNTSCKVIVRDNLVIMGIFPNVNSFCLNRAVNSTQSAFKSAVAIVKSVRQLSCVSQDIEPPELAAILRKGTEVLGPIRRVRFMRAALRQANIRENEGPSLGKIQVKNSSSAQSPRCEV